MNIFLDKVIEYGHARDKLSISSSFMEWRKLEIEMFLGFIVMTEGAYIISRNTSALVCTHVYLLSVSCSFCFSESDPEEFQVPSKSHSV